MRIFQALVAFSLFWMNTWKISPSSKGFYTSDFFKILLYPNKESLTIGIYILVILLEIIIHLRKGTKANNTINAILDHIIKTRFDGQVENTRVTVFKILPGWLCIFKLISKKIAFNRITEPKRIKQTITIPNPFRNYLWIKKRIGHPSEKGSITHFIVPRNKNEFEGICSKVAYTQKPIFVKLPPLERSDFCEVNSLDEIEDKAIRDKVKNYMKLSHINNLKKLKAINRPSMEIWASPLFAGKKIWGVLVFDQEQADKSFKTIDTELVYDSKVLDIMIG